VLIAILYAYCRFALTLSVLKRLVTAAVYALFLHVVTIALLQDSGDMTDSEDTESIDSSMIIKRHNRRRDSLIFTS
jgi:K+-transporting ATPase c subunit